MTKQPQALAVAATELRRVLEAKSQEEFSAVCGRLFASLSLLDDNERGVIVELLRQYKAYTLQDVYQLFRQAVATVDLAPPFSRTFIVPLVKQTDAKAQVVKSGLGYVHALKGLLPPQITARPIHPLSAIEALKTQYATRTNSLILLVDDYAGSGSTAASAYLEYHRNIRNSTDLPWTVFAIAQQRAVEVLEKHGAKWVAGEVRDRGISDNQGLTLDQRKEYSDAMRSVERRCAYRPFLQLGYAASQATVTICDRTPNNTFPVFWCPPGVGATLSSWAPPFRR